MTHYLDARGRPRIVITGIGVLSPLGNSLQESWDGAIAGRSGIGPITRFDASDLPCRIAGEVKDFKPKEFMNFKEARRMSRASQLAIAGARMAMQDAGLGETVPAPERAGVIVGTGMGGFERADDSLQTYRKHGLSKVSPFAITSSLANMPSHHVSLMAKTQGPISCVVAACATGTQAIGEATELIRNGRADLVLAGGVEGIIHEAAIAGFSALRAMSTGHNHEPEKACKPFDKNRNGFILSEGAGIVILEKMEDAVARGAHIYAEVLGHASSSDAFHVAAPDPEAAGAVRAMRWALEDANVPLEKVEYINAHGTGTPVNDKSETFAVKQLFGEHAYNMAISSTKSMMGHAMGGAGAIESIFVTKALQEGILPPTINYETPDPECDLDYVPNVARRTPIEVGMCNSFGLGGQNACLVLGKHHNGHH